MLGAWNPGMSLPAGEAMAKHKGWAIPLAQHLPEKPAKHGAKAFCLCCAAAGYLMALDTYLGASQIGRAHV